MTWLRPSAGFPALDADIYLPSFLEGFFGSKRWMAAQLGKADWHDLGVTREVSKLDTAKKTVEEVFEKYFELFLKAKGSAISFFQASGIYKPVRLVFADLPEFALDRERSLSEYDENYVVPFWLR